MSGCHPLALGPPSPRRSARWQDFHRDRPRLPRAGLALMGFAMIGWLGGSLAADEADPTGDTDEAPAAASRVWDRALTLAPAAGVHRLGEGVESVLLAAGVDGLPFSQLKIEPGVWLEDVHLKIEPGQVAASGAWFSGGRMAAHNRSWVRLQDCVLDSVELLKADQDVSERHSVRWMLEQCLVHGNFAPSLRVVDHGVAASRCTFHRIDFPQVLFTRNLQSDAGSDRFRFERCVFIGCRIPASLLACTIDCVFIDCEFVFGEELPDDGDQPHEVTVWIGGSSELSSRQEGRFRITVEELEGGVPDDAGFPGDWQWQEPDDGTEGEAGTGGLTVAGWERPAGEAVEIGTVAEPLSRRVGPRHFERLQDMTGDEFHQWIVHTRWRFEHDDKPLFVFVRLLDLSEASPGGFSFDSFRLEAPDDGHGEVHWRHRNQEDQPWVLQVDDDLRGARLRMGEDTVEGRLQARAFVLPEGLDPLPPLTRGQTGSADALDFLSWMYGIKWEWNDSARGTTSIAVAQNRVRWQRGDTVRFFLFDVGEAGELDFYWEDRLDDANRVRFTRHWDRATVQNNNGVFALRFVERPGHADDGRPRLPRWREELNKDKPPARIIRQEADQPIPVAGLR